MTFTSWAFVKFFLVLLIGLRLMPTRRLRQILILIGSAVFYAYWKPSYLLLLAAPSLVDYACALRIHSSEVARTRKFWLVLSLISNLGLLAYFKYCNFFLQAFSTLLHIPVKRLDILLPVGISFFTFKTMSYTIDVYRREIPACPSLLRYATFVAYFPELVAGPIVRASIFLPQMIRSLRFSWVRTAIGLQLILLGLTKKTVIADRLSPFVDAVFAHPAAYSPGTISTAVVAYSLQIYCDFSGYSDLAIGISRIIGFDLPENFNMPYRATSITEFWRRWHITLSMWLRDYLYIPLGGNRKGPWRTYLNLLLTMLLGGLWHGANWTFVFWGFLHGAALAVHKVWSARTTRRPGWTGRLTGWAATYAFVCFAWIFFRAETFSTAWTMLRKVMWVDRGGVDWFYSPLLLILPLMLLGHAAGVVASWQAPFGPPRRIPPPTWAKRIYAATGNRFALRPHPAAGIYVLLPLPGFAGSFVLAIWLLIVALFASLDTRPFIYFQF